MSFLVLIFAIFLLFGDNYALWKWSNVYYQNNRVETPLVTTSRMLPSLLSEQFSEIPKVFVSNHYIWRLTFDMKKKTLKTQGKSLQLLG